MGRTIHESDNRKEFTGGLPYFLTDSDLPLMNEVEAEKSFWFSRPDGWVINREMKKIILLEFKRTSDCGESYFQNM